jgi:hypothetical protein
VRLCKASPDDPERLNDHPASLAVREDRLLPHIDAWLATMFAPALVAETARLVVEADAAEHREDSAVTRARATLVECERR